MRRHAPLGPLVLVLALQGAACGGDGAETGGTDTAVAGDADIDEGTDTAFSGDVADDSGDFADDSGAETEDSGNGTGDSGDPFVEGAALAATATCQPTAAACADLPVDPTLRATYRKDRYFPDEVYAEYTSYPLDGGRFHVAGIAAASGAVTDVLLDGVSLADLVAPPSPRLEWYHVWPDPAVAGEPLWVAFHSRDPAWDAPGAAGALRVETAEGVALDGAFPVATTPAPVTHVTVSDDLATLLVHVRNDDAVPHTATALLVDGRDVLGGGTACVADPTLAPGQQALWTLPLCEPARPGDAWTVAVTWADAPDSVGVGRVLRPHFPVEAWGKGGECAAPGGDETAWRAHLDAGLDTFYLYWGASDTCGYQTPEVVNTVLPASDDDAYVLVGDDFFFFPDLADAITDPSRVAGFLTGDESDGSIYEEDGSPHAESKAKRARLIWDLYPELTVYNGAMTNGNVGTFAGMTDVQGIDVYLGACAPHITVSGVFRPMRIVHDYLRNTRDNHAPLPTWLYAQGLHSGWNVGPSDDPIHVQPDPQEILVQAFMVLTAGGKGLMWFQTSLYEAAYAPHRWKAIADANWAIRGVRRLVREGDVTGAVRSTAGEKLLAEAIRAREALVVPLVNLDAVETVDDLKCIEWALFDQPPPTWILGDLAPDVLVDVPADLAVTDVFEVTLDGAVVDAPWATDAAAREVRLPAVALSNDVPVRLFVLAADPAVRAEVAAELAKRPASPTLPGAP